MILYIYPNNNELILLLDVDNFKIVGTRKISQLTEDSSGKKLNRLSRFIESALEMEENEKIDKLVWSGIINSAECKACAENT